MQKWYCFLFHNISWSDDILTKGIGGTCPPDMFKSQVELLLDYGKIVTPSEALNEIMVGKNKQNLISIVFDDGLKESYTNGIRILDDLGLKGAIAACPTFYNQQDIFYRMKLSALHLNNYDDIIVNKLKLDDTRIKKHTIEEFTTEVSKKIDKIYQENFNKNEIKKHKDFFCSRNNLIHVKQQGHELLNHTLNHFPVTDKIDDEFIDIEYKKSGIQINSDFNVEDTFWVVPFGIYNQVFLDKVKVDYPDKILMLCDNKVNTKKDIKNRVIYRFTSPIISTDKYKKYLRKIFK